MLAGQLVRMYRRAAATGIVRVREERAADPAAAARRAAHLRRDGWHPWPPPPAPELATTLGDEDAELRECPFLFPVTRHASEGLRRRATKLSCFTTLLDLEIALARETQLKFEHRQPVPCEDVQTLAKDDKRPYVRELRAHCAALGIELKPDPFAVRREKGRQKRNTTFSYRVRQ